MAEIDVTEALANFPKGSTNLDWKAALAVVKATPSGRIWLHFPDADIHTNAYRKAEVTAWVRKNKTSQFGKIAVTKNRPRVINDTPAIVLGVL